MEIQLYLQEILELTNFRRNKIDLSSSFNSVDLVVRCYLKLQYFFLQSPKKTLEQVLIVEEQSFNIELKKTLKLTRVFFRIFEVRFGLIILQLARPFHKRKTSELFH